MELILLFVCWGVVSQELIPDWPVTPDDDEIYELVEDSITGVEKRPGAGLHNYRAVWRLKTESLAGAPLSLGSFLRLQLQRENCAGVVVIEKDPGETGWTDFWGAGLTFRHNRWRFTAGDYVLNFGRGLILAGPGVRSGFAQLETLRDDVLARSAQENRNWRGLRLDYQTGGRFLFTFAGSYTRRDAQLNPDGTVAKLLFSGYHRDSTAVAAKGSTGQVLTGVIMQLKLSDVCRAGVAVNGTRYDRMLVSEDTFYSFSGQNLAAGSVFCALGSSRRGGEIEFARSFPGGFAGAVRVNLHEQDWNVVLNGLLTSDRFFSPAGRSPMLTNRKARGQLTGRLGWRNRGLTLQLGGNTYYDYMMDSIPARLEIAAGYEFGRFGFDIKTARKFRLEQERFRETRLELKFERRQLAVSVYGGDEYHDYSVSRARVAGINLKLNLNPVDLRLAGAVGSVRGTGITFAVPDPGVTYTEASYNFRSSATRLALAAGIKLSRTVRLAIKLGMTHHRCWDQDWAMQLELLN